MRVCARGVRTRVIKIRSLSLFLSIFLSLSLSLPFSGLAVAHLGIVCDVSPPFSFSSWQLVRIGHSRKLILSGPRFLRGVARLPVYVTDVHSLAHSHPRRVTGVAPIAGLLFFGPPRDMSLHRLVSTGRCPNPKPQPQKPKPLTLNHAQLAYASLSLSLSLSVSLGPR